MTSHGGSPPQISWWYVVVGPGRSIGCLGGPDDASSLDQEGVREISRRDTGVLGLLLAHIGCLSAVRRGHRQNDMFPSPGSRDSDDVSMSAIPRSIVTMCLSSLLVADRIARSARLSVVHRLFSSFATSTAHDH